MKILLDENVPKMTADWLRRAGHDVKDVRGTEGQGMTDAAMWEIATRERRLLITTDKGFSEYRRMNHSGILIIRLRQPNRLKIHESVLYALARIPEADWRGLFVVMRDATMSVSRASQSGQPRA